MKEITVQTIHWSKYLDETKNPRVKNFLKHRGDDVMWQVALNCDKNGKRGRKRLVMLVHENAPYAINIPEDEYLDVLDLSLKYFQDKEEYEKCSQIVKFKENITNYRNKKKKNPLKI